MAARSNGTGPRAAGIREILKKPLLSADLAQGLARHLLLRQHDYNR
jgi:hypothetical protein